MKENKKDVTTLLLVMLWSILLGFGFGLLIKEGEVEKQTYINTQLELEYNELRRSYDELTKGTLRYDVNLDGKVTAADYVAIRNYIMNEE